MSYIATQYTLLSSGCISIYIVHASSQLFTKTIISVYCVAIYDMHFCLFDKLRVDETIMFCCHAYQYIIVHLSTCKVPRLVVLYGC